MSTTELVSSDPGYLEALEDVHTRFLLNLPDSELQTPDRIFFQLEQAWWFYEDWICDPLTKKCEEAGEPAPSLPRFSTLKPFCQQLFLFSPLLPNDRFADMWHQFSLYKRKISNYGCILLSEDYQKIVLCQVWNSKTYTLPAGKINQGENGVTAAARETYEETGFDPLCQYGLTAEWKQDDLSQDKITWKPLREQDALVFVEGRDGKGPAGKRRTCYVCHGVPSDFPFEPVVRKEVSKVTWYPIDALPKKSYAVTPFLPQLRKWIQKHSKRHGRSASNQKGGSQTPSRQGTPAKNSTSRSKQRRTTPNRKTTPNRRTHSRGKVREDQDSELLVESGLAQAGDMSGWSEEDMFKTNEKLLGRKIEYDGNPHVFAEQGFAGGQDPHAFHVVGGTFLNSGGIAKLAPAPESSRLQPLFRTQESGGSNDSIPLTPFFSSDGVTPWGEVVEDAKVTNAPPASRPQPQTRPGQPSSSNISTAGEKASVQRESTTAVNAVEQDENGVFLTDREITARSQAEKTRKIDYEAKRRQRRIQYEQDMEFVRQWVANLPRGRVTKEFGEFRLDAEAIVARAMASIERK